jgi:phage/conjugal plasmid C-4 type zinc finger TraR family protein
MSEFPTDPDERGLERIEAFERLSKDAAVARIQNNLVGIGEEFCLTCGDRIEEARRAALPSAKRCVTCQTKLEQRR